MANINHLDLNPIYKLSILTSEGCDYLRVNFEKKVWFLEEVLKKLDTDNSNFCIIDQFTYVSLDNSFGRWLTVLYTYNWIPFPVMFFQIFQRTLIKKYARLDFYGSLFRIIEVWDLPKNFISSFLHKISNEDPLITRLDYRQDFFLTEKLSVQWKKETFHKKIKKISEKTWKTRYKTVCSLNEKSQFRPRYVGDRLQSRMVWSKRNKAYVMRMYNKIDDISCKWKYFLYWDYLKYADVHRFEVEFWPHFCWAFTFSEYNLLIDKARGFLWLQSKWDYKLLLDQYIANDHITDYNRLMMTKTLFGKVDKFRNSSINPYLLIFNHFNSPDFDQEKNNYFISQFIEKVWKTLAKHM